jgi:hypothetical protein
LQVTPGLERSEEALAWVAGDADGDEDVSRDEAALDAVPPTPAVSASNGAVDR